MRTRRALVALLVVVAAGGAPVRAGVQDTPLPTFSDGQAAQLAALIPGAIKDNNVETVVICTNLAPAPLDVGLEVFDETGALRNSIAAGDGALPTLTTRSVSRIRKSSIMRPSRPTACARMPAGAGSRSVARMGGTSRCSARTNAALLTDRYTSPSPVRQYFRARRRKPG